MNRILGALAALMLAATPASADDFADFRIPDHHALQWTGTFDGSTRWGRRTDGWSHTNSDQHGGSMASDFYRLDDGEWWRSVLDVQGSLSGTRSRTDFLGFFTPQVFAYGNQRDRIVQERWKVAWDARRYFDTSRPVFAVLNVVSTGAYRQYWAEFDDVYLHTFDSSFSSWDYDHASDLTAGVGIGRVRDATALFEARTLEARLKAAGALTAPTSPRARQEVAALMYSRSDLIRVHDRPARRLWGRIETILRADGALSDSVAAGDWFSLVEPFLGRAGSDAALAPVSPVQRATGWSVAAHLQEHTIHEISRRHSSETTPSSGDEGRFVRDADATFAGIAIEYHRPFGIAWQLDAASVVLADTHTHQHGFDESSTAALGWILADRWLWVVSADHERTLLRGRHVSPYDDTASFQYGTNLSWFIEDRLAAVLSVQQQHRRFPEPITRATTWDRIRTGSVNFTLTYRFAGFAAIPLLDPLPR